MMCIRLLWRAERAHAGRVARPILIGQGVEAAAVDQGVERATHRLGLQRVRAQEHDRQASSVGFHHRALDGHARDVDAPHLVTVLGQKERVLACPATDVQDARADATRSCGGR